MAHGPHCDDCCEQVKRMGRDASCIKKKTVHRCPRKLRCPVCRSVCSDALCCIRIVVDGVIREGHPCSGCTVLETFGHECARADGLVPPPLRRGRLIDIKTYRFGCVLAKVDIRGTMPWWFLCRASQWMCLDENRLAGDASTHLISCRINYGEGC